MQLDRTAENDVARCPIRGLDFFRAPMAKACITCGAAGRKKRGVAQLRLRVDFTLGMAA